MSFAVAPVVRREGPAMTQMQRISLNFVAGVGGGALKAASFVVAHYSAFLGFISATAGTILMVFSAINAINTFRDRREARRIAAAAKEVVLKAAADKDPDKHPQ